MKEQETKLELTISSEAEVGTKRAYYVVNPTDGIPLSFSVEATFIGPTVRIVEPKANFGLVKINSSQDYRVTVENMSTNPTEIFIKDSASSLSFDSTEVSEFTTEKGNHFSFTPFCQVLAPKASSEFIVHLDAFSEEKVNLIIEIMVKDVCCKQPSQSQFIKLQANIQEPKVFLNTYSLEFGTLYAGVKNSVRPGDEKHLTLTNYGNIPVQFQWNEICEEDEMKAQFEPARGIIPPHSEQDIRFDFTLYKGGNFKQMFMCEIADREYPLAFQVTADVFGLQVIHEMQQDLSMPQMNQTQSILPGSNYTKTQTFSQTISQKLRKGPQTQELQGLFFSGCTINKPTTQTFTLKNVSGIKTTFKLKSVNFAPLCSKLPAAIQGKSSLEDMEKKEPADSQSTVSKMDSRTT